MTTKTLIPTDRILETTDLTIFKRLNGNRDVKETNVKALEKEILSHNLLEFSPILVNDKMEVIDGQTRLTVAIRHGLKIYYRVVNDIGVEEAQHLNKYSRNWTKKDFVLSYAEEGNLEYQKFLNFANEYKDLNIMNCISVWLRISDPKLEKNTSIESFTFNNRLYEIAETLIYIISLLKFDPNLKALYSKSNSCYNNAIHIIMKAKGFDKEIFFKKLKTYSSLLKHCFSRNEAVEMFLMIYNKRNSFPINIKGHKSF